MSHEIRTLMNGVLGMAELLLGTPLDKEQAPLVGAIRQSGGALLDIINDILDISKLEAGKVELEQIDFSLDELREGLGVVMAGAAQEKGLSLRVAVPPVLLGHYRGDPSRLRQVLLNLVGNAVKFTAAGRVTTIVRAAGPRAR